MTHETCAQQSVVVGTVNSGSEPVEGATVAAIKAWDTRATRLASSDSGGRFRLCLPAGEFALTATFDGLTAAYFAPKSTDDLRKVPPKLELGGSGSQLRASVGGDWNASHVRAIRIGNSIGDIFYIPIVSGTGSASLPRGSVYVVDVIGGSVSLPESADLRDSDVVKTKLHAYTIESIKEPPSDEVLAGLRAGAIEITSTSPEAGDDGDLRRIAQALEDRQVIGFGENSHGVHEFFEFRHRFLAYAARNLGYTVFALESGFARGQAINDYVLEGNGDPSKLLSEIGYWTWDIYELERTLRWMREYNSTVARPEQKLKFYGVDMQYAGVAYRLVKAFADEHSAELAELIGRAAALEDEEFTEFEKLSESQRVALCEVTSDAISLIDSQNPILAARVGAKRWRLTRQNAVVLHQTCLSFTTEYDSSSFRDASMASNLEWILEHEGPGTKAMVWAHNSHVSKSSNGWVEPMGSYLAKSLGPRYAAIGQFFHHGELRAWDTREQDRSKLSVLPVEIAPPPVGTVGDAFSRVGLEKLFLSRNAGLAPPARRWVNRPILYRHVSAVYSGEQEQGTLISLPASFDAVVFMKKVTATEAKPTGLRGPNSR